MDIVKNLSCVETKHPEYIKRCRQWELIRDCVEGEDAIKNKGEVYLPRAVGMSNMRYSAFKRRARFVNYVYQTLEGTHGMIFRRAPVLKYPAEIEKIVNNINREGSTLYQFFSDSVFDIIQTGWGGYLIDMPMSGGNISVFDAEQLGIRSYVTYYTAESIINWKFDVVNGVKVPVLVVLLEKVESDDAGFFSHELKDRFRVLYLDENREYRQLIINKSKKSNGQFGYTAEEIPVKVRGKRLGYIPFVFAPENVPQKPMFLDIAHVNIGHYMKSADYENGVHLTEFPTGWVTGATPQKDEKGNIIPMVLGQDAFLMFKDPSVKVGNLEFSGEGIAHSEKALESAELQMVVLGSRIITPERGMSETAESANIHRAGENAKLASFARNMSEKATSILRIICDWEGCSGFASVDFNTDYETMHFDANALNAMANIFAQGKVPLIVLYGMMMKGEFIPDSNMQFEDYIEYLELEHSGLSEKEAYAAYKKYKETGVSQVDTSKLQCKTLEEIDSKVDEADSGIKAAVDK